jgi:ATP-dependent RNA helicase DeaD
MLNMGFYEDIVNILSTTPDEKTWFLATMPAEVARIGKQFMKDPIEITVGAKNQVQLQYLTNFTCKCT